MIYEGNIAVFAKHNCVPKGLGLQCNVALAQPETAVNFCQSFVPYLKLSPTTLRLYQHCLCQSWCCIYAVLDTADAQTSNIFANKKFRFNCRIQVPDKVGPCKIPRPKNLVLQSVSRLPKLKKTRCEANTAAQGLQCVKYTAPSTEACTQINMYWPQNCRLYSNN